LTHLDNFLTLAGLLLLIPLLLLPYKVILMPSTRCSIEDGGLVVYMHLLRLLHLLLWLHMGQWLRSPVHARVGA
jgi:hypothetical protein